MAEKQKVYLKRSNVSGKTPTADQLQWGEVAVNYAAGGERLFMKNSSGDVISFLPDHVIIDNEEVTANALNDLDGRVKDLSAVTSTKVDKVSGKSLSTNDYTTTEKTKLAGIEAGAQVNVVTAVTAVSATTANKVVTVTKVKSATTADSAVKATTADNATTAAKVGNVISFTNSANTSVTYNGSATIDLKGGVYFASTSNSANTVQMNASTTNSALPVAISTATVSGKRAPSFATAVTINPSTGKLSAKSISEDGTALSSKYQAKGDYALTSSLTAYQKKLTAGTGIAIDADNTIRTTLDTNPFVILTGTTLPTTGIQNTKIYLLPASTTGTDNTYIEYVYINNKWEKVGEFKPDVDLSSYATTTYVNTELAKKVNSSQYIVTAVTLNTGSTAAPSISNNVLTLNVKDGTTGFRGNQGAQGAKGATGATGDKGNQGTQGDKGATGANGDKGNQGTQGDKGATGANGDKGNQGAKGATGATGDKGNQGAQGDKGATGATGNKGNQGAQGDKGATGANGDKGNQGAKGATGATGDKGNQGAQGDKGATGNKGNQGAQGDKGATGNKGNQGATGPIGTDGNAISLTNATSTQKVYLTGTLQTGTTMSSATWKNIAGLIYSGHTLYNNGKAVLTAHQSLAEYAKTADIPNIKVNSATTADSANTVQMNASTANAEYPVTISTSSTSGKRAPAFASKVTINPSNGTLKATTIYEGGTELSSKYHPKYTSVVSSSGNIELSDTQMYILGEQSSVTITLPSGADSNGLEYLCQFTASAAGCTLSVPDTISWFGGETPVINAGSTYQLSILNNLAVIGEF